MNKYYWLNDISRQFLAADYLEQGVTPEDRIWQIARAAEKILGIEGFAEKFEGYMSQGFYSLSTPVWTNFGTDRGLPVSCFGGYIPDTMVGILDRVGECGIMSKMGGGTSGYFGGLRHRGAPIRGGSGGLSAGPVHFAQLFDCVSDVVSQGSTRRGSYAGYLDVEHPDIEEFLRVKTEGNPIQRMHFGVCISDEWMASMIAGDKYKRKIWAKIIERRYEKGEPYIFFSGNANKNKPQVYKDKEMTIYASNLCSEIMLPSNEDESFVCVLSSLNLVRWEEIEKTDAVETLIYFLDAVNEEFIRKTQEMRYMEAAHKFAKRHRALGMGGLGWHTFLQSKMIAFESMEAKMWNNRIWKTIRERSDRATEQLAVLFGEPETLKGYGRRNTTTLAVAPNTSSSVVCGQVSQSIEPEMGVYFTNNTAKLNISYRNPIFENLLVEKGQNTDEVWRSILERGGSVQHLPFLSKNEKDVFKTFSEISQKEIVIQAGQRQKFLDQGQSLNLRIAPTIPAKEVSQLLIFGWEQGVKSFYYQRSANPSQELARSIMTCVACEG